MEFNSAEVLEGLTVTVQWFGIGFGLYLLFEGYGLMYKLFREYTDSK